MIILKAQNVTKTYAGKEDANDVEVLKGVNIELESGSTHAIVGTSGSGKSTLLHILGGLDKPTSGEVIFRDHDIASYSDEQVTQFRNREIGFVFQFHHLLPEFTAIENVMMPALVQDISTKEVKKRAEQLLAEFGLKDRLHHRPSMLSGGEQQRVSVARALMNNPSLLLADEPSGNLDENNTSILIDLLLSLNKERELTIILVTHDPILAQKCTKIHTIKNGTID